MGLFYEILSAVNNPNQQASVGQLGAIANGVQQVSELYHLDASATQSVISMVGNQLRSVLQQQRAGGGGEIAGNLMGQGTGGNPLENLIAQVARGTQSVESINSLIPSQIQQQLIERITQKTGLNADSIQGMLPSLIAVVLNFLNLGAALPGSQGSNSVLNAFLDSEKDGDVDLGDVVKFSNRFLNPPSS